MNLVGALQHVVDLTATFDPRMAALLFAVCAIGEASIPIPYVLESVWLLAGYQLGSGELSPLHLLGLWLAAQCGRQVGALALYRAGRMGAPLLVGVYHKLPLRRFFSRVTAKSGVFNRINLTSPFSVAYGRLFGLRIPVTLTLAVTKNLRILSLGVLLSSIVCDGLYISLGIIFGSTTGINPVYMLLASLAGLTILYVVPATARSIIAKSYGSRA